MTEVLISSAAKANGEYLIFMNEQNARQLLLQKYWNENISPMRLLTNTDILDNNKMFFDIKERKWHLWREPRVEYRDMYEPNFTKPDFVFIDNSNNLYVVELKSCWYRKSENLFTYCIDLDSPRHESESVLHSSQLEGYDLVGCYNTIALKSRAECQMEKNKAMLKNIIVGDQKLSNKFGEVIGLSLVCVYNSETNTILGFS